MNSLSLPGVLWFAAGVLLLTYFGLCFAARAPVAIRPQRLGLFCLAAVLIRLGLWGAGYPVSSTAGETAVVIGAVTGAALVCVRRSWLVRDSLAHVRQQIQNATQGLFLQAEEPQPGRFLLPTREGSRRLSVRPLTSRWMLVMLPASQRRSKVALLISWLSKQYPGPIPRLRINLERKSP